MSRLLSGVFSVWLKPLQKVAGVWRMLDTHDISIQSLESLPLAAATAVKAAFHVMRKGENL